MQISKSDFMCFMRHPAWLWVKKHDPENIPPPDASTQAKFDAGHAFEPYVESLFPGGVSLGFDDFKDYDAVLERTQKALASGAKTLFQPRFIWKEFTCLSDIITVVDDKAVDLYEIKSSTKVRPEYYYDLAFQAAVIENNGLSVRDIWVIHVNNQYIRQGEVDARQLTTFENITKEMGGVKQQILGLMEESLAVANSETMPDPDPKLAKFGSKPDWLKIYQNIFPTEPEAFPDDAKPSVERPKIAQFLDNLEYPLYFFDYETLASLIPRFDGQRPYQQVPFQYSLHIINQPGGEVEHREYLHRDNSNPAPEVVKQLIKDVGGHGSIVVWFMGFEKSVNEELARMYPEYADQIMAINNRIVDLMIPFKSKWYDDPRFGGSASLKNVMPVVCPDLSYQVLNVQEGETAQRLWMETILDGKNADQKDQILADLSKYCELDTWAMVRIWQELVKIARNLA